jgi:hypothetical protein
MNTTAACRNAETTDLSMSRDDPILCQVEVQLNEWYVSRLVKLAASSWLTVSGLGCSITQRENGLL